MGRARWIGWVRDENGKTYQTQSRADVEAREKEFEFYNKSSLELDKRYSTLKEEEMIAVQESLANKINLTNRFAVSNLKTIAGADLSYIKDKDGNEAALCCIVVMDIRTKEILDTSSGSGTRLPPVSYRSGFLSFREIPAILAAYKYLWCKPDLLMLDGNGYLHCRHMGLATHTAIELNIPAIGVAKSFLKIDDFAYTMPKNEIGAYTDIVIHGEVYGGCKADIRFQRQLD